MNYVGDFAYLADVEAVMPPLTDDQRAAAPGLIAQASTLIRGWGLQRGFNVDDLIASDLIRQEIVKVATVAAVKRALGNLTGILETTVAIDDYRRTDRRDKETSSGNLIIDDGDLLGLIPASKRGKFGTLRMGSAL